MDALINQVLKPWLAFVTLGDGGNSVCISLSWSYFFSLAFYWLFLMMIDAPSNDHCSWRGVTCDNVTFDVVALNLSHLNLGGEISPVIGNLKSLESIDLKGNGLSGQIPDEIGDCSALKIPGMGFNNNTSIFLASGKIYKAEKNMAPLQQMFPLLQTKETLASPEELAPFEGYSSRMATLDYIVCLHCEVFVTTQGCKFPHLLMGHRRYFYKGHAKAIKPEKRKLALLFDNPKIRWETFKRHMQAMCRHNDAKGIELRKENGSVYTFPVPDCMSRRNLEKLRSPNIVS